MQRIEDFPDIVVLAINLKDNLDEVFSRCFQSVLYFLVPDQQLRLHLWQQMVPKEWFANAQANLLQEIAHYKIAAGSMINVIQRCALHLYQLKTSAIEKELDKEGKIIWR